MAVATLALAACAPGPGATWEPPKPTEGVVHATSPVKALDAGQSGPLGSGIVPLRLRNDVVGMQARVALLPESPSTTAFNAAVGDLVRTAIDARAAASGAVFTPTPSGTGSGLGDRRCVTGSTARPAADLLADPVSGPAGGSGAAVVCDLVVAAGGFVGERVRVVEGDAAGIGSDSVATFYADTATGETVTAEGLWSETAGESIGTLIADVLRREAGALSRRPSSLGDEARAAVQVALSTTVPDAEGLVVTLAPGFTTPELEALGVAPTSQARAFAVPEATAAPLVSPFGAALLAAAGQPYSGPAAPPAGTRPVDCTLVPCVALTYDDGPSDHTPAILDALAERDAAATFFAMGEKAQGFAETLARMTREGHEVEGHTWNHPHLPFLSSSGVRAQILDSTQALENASGQDITAFRPPWGEYNPAVLAAAGMPAILWDVDSEDWLLPPEDALVARVVNESQAGSIVLMHDLHPGTAGAAGAIYDGLLDRGFQLVTVKQLFGGELPASGAWWRGP